MNKIKTKDVSNLIILYQTILYIAMISGYKGIAYYISFFVVALFVGKIIARNGGNIPTNKSWNNFMLFLVFYIVTSMFNFNRANFYVYLIYYIIVFFPILISEYLKVNSTTEMIEKSLKCFIYIFIGFCLISIGYYLSHPGLAREMAAHLVEDRLAIGGGYSLAYAAAVLSVYLFSKMSNKSIEKKLSYVFVCIICVYLVYLTQSSLTFFAMIIGMVISFVMRGNETAQDTKNTIFKTVIIGVVVVAAAIIVVYSKDIIAEWILNKVDGKAGNIIYSRIEEVVNKLVYGKTTRHVDKRDAVLTSSIEIFKRYPLFGVGFKYGNVFKYGNLLGVGNHSEILDAFARYGIVGGSLWLFPYFQILKMIYKKNLGCAITILLMMYYNPFVSFHSNVVMFMFIPLFEELLNRKRQKALEIGADEVN